MNQPKEKRYGTPSRTKRKIKINRGGRIETEGNAAAAEASPP